MRTAEKFLLLSITDKKLYELALDGNTWSEFPVQPPLLAATPGGLLCGTPDGRIAVADGSSRMLHWDPDTDSWEVIAYPGFATSMQKAAAAGPSGDMIAEGSHPSGTYLFQYEAATKTWTKIAGPWAVNCAHGSSLTDVWSVGSVGSTGYVYHSTGGGVWSADLWPQIVADIGFWPHVPCTVFAVSPTEVYFTTWPGSVSYGIDDYAQIIKWDGFRFSAINCIDVRPAPGNGIPDCAPHSIHDGLWVSDQGKVYTSGNFITISTNYIHEFVLPGGRAPNGGWGSGGWVELGVFTQGAGSCYAPIIAAGGSLLVYGFYTSVITRLYRGGVWTTLAGLVSGSGTQPAILYGPDYPEIVNETPFAGQINANPAGWVEFDATDGDNSIAPSETTISLAGVPAWAADAPLPGFAGSRTAIAGGQHYVIYRSTGWTSGEEVAVSVHAEDTLGLEVDETWSFTALIDIPTCAWGGGQYGEPEPPYGLCLAVPLDRPYVVLAESLSPTSVRVTFSAAMLLNADLCDPTRYVFSDGLSALRVRRLSAETVLVKTTHQIGWHTYRLRVEGS